MTSPDRLQPPTAQLGSTLGTFYQTADRQALAQASNVDLWAMVEEFRHRVFDMLGGFGDVAEAVWDGLSTLIDALTGGGSTLDDVVAWVGTLGQVVGDLLKGVIPIGWLSADTPNLLANGGFDGAASMTAGEGWTWDAAVGRSAVGAARFDASGVRGLQQSTPVQVADGQVLDAEVWVKWSGVATSASTAAWKLAVRWWDGDTLLAETVVDTQASPSASGGWVKLDGSATTPAGADLATLALSVEDVVTAGQVWWDDASCVKPSTSIPQQWVSGLVDALGDLGDWIKGLIDRITGKVWASIGDALGGLSTWTTQLGTILGGGSPANILPSLAGHTISTLHQMLTQIGQVFQGAVVTPINSVVQDVKDWFFDLIGWKTTSSANHQSLKDNVWSGATQVGGAVSTGKTDEQIRQAVAALRARSEAQQAATEMAFLSAMPIWQGLIPGGDVTTPLQMLNYDYGSIAAAPHFTLFRAKNSFPIEKVSFLALVSSGTNPTAWSGAYLLLLSYNEDTNTWACVAKSNDFKAELGTTRSWIHTSFSTAYTPRVGEDLAILARPATPGGTTGFMVTAHASPLTGVGIPASTQHPRGGLGLVSANIPLDVGDSFSGDSSSVSWVNGVMPFYHFSPDLGQQETFPPIYWFDDFNTPSGSWRYKFVHSGSTSSDAKMSDGRMEFNGSTDGRQGLIYLTAMNTDDMAIEADVVFDAVNWGQTSTSVIGLHQNVALDGGVAVVLDRNSGGRVTLYRGHSLSSPSGGVVVGSISGHNPEGRWRIQFTTADSTYRVIHNGVALGALTLSDPSDLVGRGKARRYGVLSVARASFQNSLGWDNLLIQDL